MSEVAITVVTLLSIGLGFCIGYIFGRDDKCQCQDRLDLWMDEYKREIELCNAQYDRFSKPSDVVRAPLPQSDKTKSHGQPPPPLPLPPFGTTTSFGE